MMSALHQLGKRLVVGTPFEDNVRTILGRLREPRAIAAEDAMTLAIMGRTVSPDASCIDVGCHKGFFLEHMVELAPRGRHFAFEPIPRLHRALAQRFAANPQVLVLPYALGESRGVTTFHHNRDNPAFSGILRRRYPSNRDRVDIINVELRTLDEVIPYDARVAFIKLDVEGAELRVLRGAIGTIARCSPTIVFEFGTGSSEFYGTGPDEMWSFFAARRYAIWRLPSFLARTPPLRQDELRREYEMNSSYYFVAGRLLK